MRYDSHTEKIINVKVTLLLLAAGMGSRYGGLKQLDRVGPAGETLMDYSIFDAIRAGFSRVVFVIRRDIEAEFKAVIGSRYAGRIEVDYAFQSMDDLPAGFSVPPGREKPWGTGQAVYAARDVIREPFAVINADDFYGRESYEKLAGYLKTCRSGRPLDGCMCGYRLRRTLSENGSVSRGVCRTDAEGHLVKVIEHTKIARESDGRIISTLEDGRRVEFTGDELVSMNCWGFAPEIFDELGRLFAAFLAARGSELKSEFYLPFAADELIAEKRAAVRMLESDADWFGITYREDRPVVVEGLRSMVAAGHYPEKLFR